jgi:hypothetical protein
LLSFQKGSKHCSEWIYGGDTTWVMPSARMRAEERSVGMPLMIRRPLDPMPGNVNAGKSLRFKPAVNKFRIFLLL